MKQRIIAIIVFSLSLVACSSNGGGDTGHPPTKDTRDTPISEAAAQLPNYSAEVESVQGQDPRRYFIANMPALNAVDADEDGIWDDVQERLKREPIIAEAHPQAVRLMVLGHQKRMLYRSQAQAHANNPSTYARGLACLVYHAGRAKGARVSQDVSEAVKRSIYVSEARILASLYADGLSSGGVYRMPDYTIEACVE